MAADGVRVRTKDCRHGRLAFLAHDLYVGRSLDLYGEFSEHEVHVFRQILGDGAVVLEAGANIGALTVPLARIVGPRGRIVAYEPQPAMASLLRHNLETNGIAWAEVRQAALGRTPGTLRLPPVDYGAPYNFGGVMLRDADDSDGGDVVPVETIDALALPRLDLLKVDVEGMEVAVLAGAADTIRRLQPLLYVENDREENSRAVIEAILALGYQAWWHFPRLYNPENFFANADNVFPRVMSANLVCAPAGRTSAVVGTPVEGPDDTWKTARARERAAGIA